MVWSAEYVPHDRNKLTNESPTKETAEKWLANQKAKDKKEGKQIGKGRVWPQPEEGIEPPRQKKRIKYG